MNKKKGFTLIELLAVIVILGLIIAIAIPSISKYITESRKKTIIVTIGNYVNGLAAEVNDREYSFKNKNTIYAVPIECISLERGGKNPFGEWHQANNDYFAYVLVQYNEKNSSYLYGFVFKDSAGYGMYPVTQDKFNLNGKQVLTDLELSQPKTGSVTNLTSFSNWENSGFDVNSDTKLVVLEAETEGMLGNGKTTCTLMQKGSNYDDVESAKTLFLLTTAIRKDNDVITKTPTLSTSINNTTDLNGLYISNLTNTGKDTYYFRGNVENNYVSFAGLTWRIIRINEDGTTRLILDDSIGNDYFDNSFVYYEDGTNLLSEGNSYYSDSNNIKLIIDEWYIDNLLGYDKYIATSNYCEQGKVVGNGYLNVGGSIEEGKLYTSYNPNFKCATDSNGKGILNLKIGLITYDEVVYAGGYYNESNVLYYLNDSNGSWTMSPAGSGRPSTAGPNYHYLWEFGTDLKYNTSKYSSNIRPVINLDADVMVSGKGTKDNMYIVQTKDYNEKLTDLVNNNSTIINEIPTLNRPFNDVSDKSGLYVSNLTNSGENTYYFRGNVENNYVSFAGYTWRIVRINEDGTTRLILNDSVNFNVYYGTPFSTYTVISGNTVSVSGRMYYSDKETLKSDVDKWYETNLNRYDKYIALGEYCEQARVKLNITDWTEGMSVYSEYEPSFTCSKDVNEKGILNLKIGLITYDEVVFAGGYTGQESVNLYLNNGSSTWTMSPGGYVKASASSTADYKVWSLANSLSTSSSGYSHTSMEVRPVINLKAGVVATGTGTIDDMYTIPIN